MTVLITGTNRTLNIQQHLNPEYLISDIPDIPITTTSLSRIFSVYSRKIVLLTGVSIAYAERVIEKTIKII
jgi:hypothetical protein